MYHVVEAADKDWLLIEDESRSEYDDRAQRSVYRSAEFRVLSKASGEDVLLVLCGMNMNGGRFPTTFTVHSEQEWERFTADRQLEVSTNETHYPSLEAQHG